MARTISDYIDPALDALNAGFASAAAKKRAHESVASAYELGVKRAISDALLADRTIPAWDARYWGVPALHHWAIRHDTLFDRWPEVVRLAHELRDLRLAIKAAKIAALPPRAEHPLKVAAYETIVELMARRQSQYAEALDLAERFGGLPVSVNVHMVHGHKGAVFPRCFFYLAGRFTPLQIIIAAAQELERRENKGA